ERFLQFFIQRGHTHLPSSSLVPKNDPTVLLTTAGMLQFKPIFMGLEKRRVPRATTVQKCCRTTDLDSVGRTARHHTFFEMLGNFSFGDYFKSEVIPWAWEFLTVEMKLPVDRLYVTVFTDDDEAADIWKNKVGVPSDHIVRLGEDTNFWAAGPTGPCGPCSEILYDLGPEFGCPGGCGPECDCGRYLEIWNLVFMQFNRDEAGTLTPLPAKNIDTGMGLERLASVLQGVPNNFETDLIFPIVEWVANRAKVSYGDSPEKDLSLKIVADHTRALIFLIADGVTPSNEGRGYVLRRIIRRAIRHGKLLGIQGAFLKDLVDPIVEMYSHYPELPQERNFIFQTIAEEEKRFGQTIDRGVLLLSNAIATLGPDQVLSGETAFELYDTYGFPLELTIELASEKGIKVDLTGFEAQMSAQRERARQAREQAGVTFAEGTISAPATQFTGYENLTEEATVQEVFVDKQERPVVVLNRSPFYAESGGQLGDRGTIAGEPVVDTQKRGDVFVHILAPGAAVPEKGSQILAMVDPEWRDATRRHHTATHLLQAALQKVLGDKIKQAGSQVGPDELRFDFTFPRGLTEEELVQVEDLVNQAILSDLEVCTVEMALEEAQKTGAMALFGEKYGDKVRVVSAGEFSRELCGGTHVATTGRIGSFKINREEGIAAGVRRITAFAGMRALSDYRERFNLVSELTATFKASPAEIPGRIERLQGTIKEQETEIKQLKQQLAVGKSEALLAQKSEVKGHPFVAAIADLDADGLKAAADALRDRLHGIVVLGSRSDGKVSVVATVPDELVKEGGHAGKLVQQIMGVLGGRGGGKPQMAQGGGGNPEALDQAIAQVKEILASQLK
ncbi:MAG: alanine--tRNA ligase, partial [Bacteroidota bacterium]